MTFYLWGSDEEEIIADLHEVFEYGGLSECEKTCTFEVVRRDYLQYKKAEPGDPVLMYRITIEVVNEETGKPLKMWEKPDGTS